MPRRDQPRIHHLKCSISWAILQSIRAVEWKSRHRRRLEKIDGLSSGLSANSSSNILKCRSLSYRNGLLSHNIRLLSHNIRLLSPSCSFRLQCLHLFRSSRRSKVISNCGRCCLLNLRMEMDKGMNVRPLK